jgi:molecular chaperone GrpE (heat shock protein)
MENEDYKNRYLLHDKVLRFANVKVSLPLSAEGKD